MDGQTIDLDAGRAGQTCPLRSGAPPPPSVLSPADEANAVPLALRLSSFLLCRQELLSSDADVALCDKSGRCALHFAAQQGSPKVISLLISAKAAVAAVDNSGKRPLQYLSQEKPQYRQALQLLTGGHKYAGQVSPAGTPDKCVLSCCYGGSPAWTPPQGRGGGGAPLYGPRNGCTGQWMLWALEIL